MINLSQDLLNKLEGLEEVTPEQQKEIENEFLKGIRDEESPYYNSFLKGLDDEYLLGMLRMMMSSLKTQVNKNNEVEGK